MVSALFYRVLIQVVLLFGLESWALSEVIIRVVEKTHVGLFHQITENQDMQQTDGAWETPVTEEVLRAARMQLAANYTGRREVIIEH